MLKSKQNIIFILDPLISWCETLLTSPIAMENKVIPYKNSGAGLLKRIRIHQGMFGILFLLCNQIAISYNLVRKVLWTKMIAAFYQKGFCMDGLSWIYRGFISKWAFYLGRGLVFLLVAQARMLFYMYYQRTKMRKIDFKIS